MVNSVDFAGYLRQRAVERGLTPNVTQIQKWLYACYGIYLAVNNNQFFDEQPRAWQYGPVFKNVYTEQKSSKGLPRTFGKNRLSKYDEIIDVVLMNFGDWTATQLVDWTHQEGGAWEKQWERKILGFMSNSEILEDFEGMFINE